MARFVSPLSRERPCSAAISAFMLGCEVSPAIGANATTKVKRTDFNMGKNVPYVGDEVTIDIALEAVKQ